MKRYGSLVILSLAVACTGDSHKNGLGSGGSAPAFFEGPSGKILKPAPPKPIPQAATDRKIALPETPAASGSGLTFSLEDGTPADPAQQQTRLAVAQPISQERADKIAARLAPIQVKADDTKDFALRARSKPAPRPGKTIKASFPPKGMKAPPVTKRNKVLKVLRVQPQGDIPIGGHLSVTFSEPMVAISSHDNIAEKDLPVRLSPEPEGQWRWVGSKTLLFEPKARFPMATEFVLTVPAGARSMTGSKLAEPFTQKFRTPPPRVVASQPHGTNQRRNAVVRVAFDQRINPEAVMPYLKLIAGRGALGIERVLPEDNADVKSFASSYGADRVVAFRAKQQLPYNSQIRVSVRKGVPSAEGPRKSTKAHAHSFRTFGPFKLNAHYCAYRNNRNCMPGQAFVAQFSNSIDGSKFKKEMVRVTPKIEGLKVTSSGSYVYVHGRTTPQTTYTVRINDRLFDIFGQKIDKSHTLTFKVGKAAAQLSALGGNLVVSDPAIQRKPTFSIYSNNYPALTVELRSVEHSDWYKFAEYLQRYRDRYQKNRPRLPGRVELKKTIRPKSKGLDLKETSIDLGPALKKGKGKGSVIVDVRVKGWKPKNRYDYEPRVLRWVQVTDLAVDGVMDGESLLSWVTSLTDGSPVSGVDTGISTTSEKLRTNQAGLARLALPKSRPGSPALLYARTQDDQVFIPERMWGGSYSNWHVKSPGSRTHRFFVFDDRKLYKPKEKVNIKGWIRDVTPGKLGDLAPFEVTGKKVFYKATGPRGNEISKGEVALSALAGFNLSFDLPDDINLGNGSVTLRVGESESSNVASHYHSFQIQEFRRPEFEVSMIPSSDPHFIGEYGTMTLSAKYYAGGGLTGSKANWSFNASAGSYRPPNHDGYTFGAFVPWWYHRGRWGGPQPSNTYKQMQGTTDAAGLHTVRINFESVDPPRPMVLSASGSVRDLNNQTWSANGSMVVHPSSVYVGIKAKRPFVEKGQPIKLDVIRVGLDGKPAPGKVEVVATQTYGDKPDKQTCSLNVTDEDPEECEFKSDKGGSYRIVASVTDERGRKNQSEMTIWISGGKTLPTNRAVSKEQLTLIPDKPKYEVGDTAEILVRAPFAPAEGLLTIERQGVLQSRRFKMDTATHVLNVKIEEGYLPNVYASVEVVGASARINADGEVDEKLAKRPAFAGASLALSVSTLSRTLTVDAQPVDTYLPPGIETHVDVQVRDHTGEPVPNAEVALFVVDESVLALSNYALTDPVSFFYTNRGRGAWSLHTRQYVLLGDAESPAFAAANEDASAKLGNVGLDGMMSGSGGGGLRAQGAPSKPMSRARRAAPAEAEPAPMMDMAEKSMEQKREGGKKKSKRKSASNKDRKSDGSGQIAVRSNFSALAVFAPEVKTDSGGRARVPFKLPDNLTRYRVMAVAVSGAKHFGKSETALTVAMPVMVRPSPPRFMNFGDKFELPVIVQNQTAQELTAAMVVRASNAKLTASSAVEFKVPAQDRVEVRFPVSSERPGIARFQVAVTGDGFNDAAELSLPVWTPATTEAFATYGEIDKGAISQPVQIPGDVEKGFGGLELSFASTNLQGLTDAVIYIVNYPFACSEQRSSRILTIAALKDVLTAFDAEGLPPEADLIASVAEDMKALERMQHRDGGWGFWGRRWSSWPFVSIHVVHAMLRARAKKFDVPTNALNRGLNYLRNIERHIPSTYGPASRRHIIAYSIYVRALNGEMDAKRARSVIRSAGGVAKLPLTVAAWLYPVLSDSSLKKELSEVRRLFNNRATETAATAHFATSFGEGAHLILHSDRRADALILEGMIGDDKKNPLIPKIVKGLLAHRKRGRWSSTQENAWVILALDKYFRTYEKVTPDFFAGAWLNEDFIGGRKFAGRETVRYAIDVPMAHMAKTNDLQDLIIGKEGPGRMYYRAGLSYAPKNLMLEPADHGFYVERRYEAIDDPADVRRDEQGVWHVKAGSKVRVVLSMTNTARRYHVALVDPLPAGFEPINPALPVMAGQVGQGDLAMPPKKRGRSYYWWFSRWYEHQNLRDERVEAFSSLLWAGEHNYVYLARATTRGSFVVPPTKAEEMYFPETFGRSASERVIVE